MWFVVEILLIEYKIGGIWFINCECVNVLKVFVDSLKDWVFSELNLSVCEFFNVCYSLVEEFDFFSLFDVRKKMILCVIRLCGW